MAGTFGEPRKRPVVHTGRRETLREMRLPAPTPPAAARGSSRVVMETGDQVEADHHEGQPRDQSSVSQAPAAPLVTIATTVTIVCRHYRPYHRYRGSARRPPPPVSWM